MRDVARGWRPAALAGVVVVLAPLTAFLVTVWLFGWQLQSVQSGSMRPTFNVGSLLVVAPIAPGEVRPGMAITFVDPLAGDRMVTHRVVRLVDAGGPAFVTRGDANAAADPQPVAARYVRGQVRWAVTGLGTVLDWLQWPRSFLLLVVLPGIVLVALEVRARRPARPRGGPA